MQVSGSCWSFSREGVVVEVRAIEREETRRSRLAPIAGEKFKQQQQQQLQELCRPSQVNCVPYSGRWLGAVVRVNAQLSHKATFSGSVASLFLRNVMSPWHGLSHLGSPSLGNRSLDLLLAVSNLAVLLRVADRSKHTTQDRCERRCPYVYIYYETVYTWVRNRLCSCLAMPRSFS